MLKRFILWDYPRGGWQYDVMVGIILAFIFLTPREWFRDQARIPKASSIAMLPTENGSSMFFVDAQLLAGIPENQARLRSSPNCCRRAPVTGASRSSVWSRYSIRKVNCKDIWRLRALDEARDSRRVHPGWPETRMEK